MTSAERTWIDLKEDDLLAFEKLVYFIRTELIENKMLFEHDIEFLEDGRDLLDSWMEELVNHKNERLNLD